MNNKNKNKKIFLRTDEKDTKKAFLAKNAIKFIFALILGAFFLLPAPIMAEEIDSAKLVNLTNMERQKEGLPPLKVNSLLTASSSAKLKDIFDRQYFNHDDPDGNKFSKFILGQGYNFVYAGENLAIDFDSNEDIVRAWMESPTHRKNILNANYEDIGISVMSGFLSGRQTMVVVQHFGKLFPKAMFAPQPGTYMPAAVTIESNQLKRTPSFLSSYEDQIVPKDNNLLSTAEDNFFALRNMNYDDPINIFVIINSFIVTVAIMLMAFLFNLGLKISHRKIRLFIRSPFFKKIIRLKKGSNPIENISHNI